MAAMALLAWPKNEVRSLQRARRWYEVFPDVSDTWIRPNSADYSVVIRATPRTGYLWLVL